ncbi:hypothetical protein EYF80_030446 [Liparis tanakae]|uniref:Uncharacterized protein n=1 Tax=Liparis tanakae TaxID=230148 RepID=A0A4Z2H2N2_9TELE|nr:hypothetical protein EYF80_030446 [Liparis tanakae]
MECRGVRPSPWLVSGFPQLLVRGGLSRLARAEMDEVSASTSTRRYDGGTSLRSVRADRVRQAANAGISAKLEWKCAGSAPTLAAGCSHRINPRNATVKEHRIYRPPAASRLPDWLTGVYAAQRGRRSSPNDTKAKELRLGMGTLAAHHLPLLRIKRRKERGERL